MIKFWITLIFAICLIGFGSLGYYKTGSLMSLYTSLTFGILLIVSSYGMFAKRKWGLLMAEILTALLTAVFFRRMCITGKVVPSILACASLAMFCFLLIQDWKARKRS
jgi:uncharacterized membrane protein (UPF0136 family)